MRLKIKRKVDKESRLSSQEIVDFLLADRKIKNPEEFLNPKHPKEIPFENFFSKKQFEKILKKLKEIKDKQEMIVVYTDYDADGITGGAILWETLYLLGFKVMPYVPHRKLEGYGFSKKGLEAVKKLYQPSLIISVDHGIAASEKITYAKSLGIPVIITDHHLKPEKTPKDAFAIFHTDQFSGAGIAYFFAKEIFQNFQFPISNFQTNFKLLEENFKNDYLALASIGTIADLVPLIGPSRSIARHGLESFSKVKRYGIKHILKEAGIENRKITPYEIGFMIAPRINALGRLEHALDGLRLLCTKNENRAKILATKLGKKNRERQTMLEEAIEEAKEKLKTTNSKLENLPKIIILISDKWHEGIIGLIAAKIVEEFSRPTIVLTKADGFYKGSARSIPNFHITNFLRSLKKYLIDVGGHKQAAGFTLEKNQLNNFCTMVQNLSSSLIKDEDLERIEEVDLEIPLSKVNLSLVKFLEKLQPYGIGNPQPTFYSQGKIVDAKIFGKKNEHLKIFISDIPQSVLHSTVHAPQTLEFIAFGQASKFTELSKNQIIDVVYNLEINRWGEEEKVRGRIINLFIK